MMKEMYANIMKQSLEKKIQILDRIIELNQEQRIGLEDPNLTPEQFDETVEAKAEMIEQLEQLDSGFEKLFAHVKEELEGRKELFAPQIKEMQQLIRAITDKSIEIQTQEARNKNLMTQKFTMIREQSKSVRTSNKVATQYYKNMAKINYIDPQFMDNKN